MACCNNDCIVTERDSDEEEEEEGVRVGKVRDTMMSVFFSVVSIMSV